MGTIYGLTPGMLTCIVFSLAGLTTPRGCDHQANLETGGSFAQEAVTRQATKTPQASASTCQPSESVGRPWKGRLKCGQLLPEHPRLLAGSDALFGTGETMDNLRQAADFMDEVDPDGPPIEILDISLDGGGPFHYGHVSHQSGRDVDVSYFYASGFHPGGVYREVPLDKLNILRTWIFLRGLIRTGRVQLILIDHDIQALLYKQAKQLGACNLGRIFQYPRGPRVRRGLIRHYPHHRHHIHIRFRCPKGDKRCRG